MVMINKEDFAWQGRFLSPKLLFQMFLHCPSPRASPLVPHQGLLPPDRGPSSSEKWQKLGLSLPEISHERFRPTPLDCVFSARRGPPPPREQSVASSRVSSQGLWKRAGGGGTLHSHVGSAGVSF